MRPFGTVRLMSPREMAPFRAVAIVVNEIQDSTIRAPILSKYSKIILITYPVSTTEAISL